MTAPGSTSDRSPLSIVWDVIVAPASAFEALDIRPRWVVAFIVICVLGMVGALLQIPAGSHVQIATINRQISHDPNMASLSPTQLANIKTMTSTIQHFVWIAYPVITLVGISITALILLAGNAIGKGSGTFQKYFALAANIGIIQLGIAYCLIGILASLHPPDSFDSASDLFRLPPSLAWVVPSDNPKLTAFLACINPFTIWSFILFSLGLQKVGKVAAPAAWITAAIVGFGQMLFAVPFAQ